MPRGPHGRGTAGSSEVFMPCLLPIHRLITAIDDGRNTVVT
jgi:hypothetical protein